jgi:NAD(P)-dependent dehydrogenase (short-subunit alcohol dehydrogenase family)
MLLEDKVAIVTGVGPGLGRRVALAMAREGASVVLAARTESFLQEVAKECEELGAAARWSSTDVTKADQCQRLVDTAVDEFGRIDVLVNGAYRPDVFEPVESVDLTKWRKIFEVNLFGNLQVTQLVVPHLKRAGGGAIVFVNSMIIRKVLPANGGYAASKSALLTAARALAAELGPDGIRVNSVLPGWMWGPSVQGYVGMMAHSREVDEQTVIDEIANDIPLRTIPPDEDVAEAVVFLASDRARMITGQTLDVNGGEVFS